VPEHVISPLISEPVEQASDMHDAVVPGYDADVGSVDDGSDIAVEEAPVISGGRMMSPPGLMHPVTSQTNTAGRMRERGR